MRRSKRDHAHKAGTAHLHTSAPDASPTTMGPCTQNRAIAARPRQQSAPTPTTPVRGTAEARSTVKAEAKAKEREQRTSPGLTIETLGRLGLTPQLAPAAHHRTTQVDHRSPGGVGIRPPQRARRVLALLGPRPSWRARRLDPAVPGARLENRQCRSRCPGRQRKLADLRDRAHSACLHRPFALHLFFLALRQISRSR